MSSFIDSLGLICLTIDSGIDHKVVGRTKLQKMIYFTQYLNWNIGEYGLHHYGPFSFDVADNLNTARLNNLVEETKDLPYKYNLTSDGEKFLTKFVNKVCDSTKVKQTTMLIRYLSEWSKKELELVSTIDFVHNNNLKLDKKDLLKKVGIIKENYSSESIQNAYMKWLELKNLYL